MQMFRYIILFFIFAPTLAQADISTLNVPESPFDRDACREGTITIDPRFMPLAASWIVDLPTEYPLFQKGDVVCENGEHLSGSERRPFVYKTIPIYRPYFGVEVAPKHIRIKRNPNGTPALVIHKNLFGKYDYVTVEFELGVFGEERRALYRVLQANNEAWNYVKLQSVRIFPIDPAWNAEKGVIEQSDVSLYSSFEQVDVGAFSDSPFREVDADMVMWSGSVSFVTSRSGTELMAQVMKHGLFNFPMVAQIEIKAATFPDSVPSRTPKYKIATSIHMLSMTIAGGLACSKRNFWGNSRISSANGCEHYWAD
ncbi:hypothetical protein WDW37_04995 [Bdellovibrionota bacterium FG-1]